MPTYTQIKEQIERWKCIPCDGSGIAKERKGFIVYGNPVCPTCNGTGWKSAKEKLLIHVRKQNG